jgi:hypothetical protein
MSWSPCAEFCNGGAIPASCLRGPFLVSRLMWALLSVRNRRREADRLVRGRRPRCRVDQSGFFVVVGPDTKIVKFKSRREAKDWCAAHHPGSPIKEIGADEVKRTGKTKARKPK